MTEPELYAFDSFSTRKLMWMLKRRDSIETWFVTYLPLLPSGVFQPLKFLSHALKCVLGADVLECNGNQVENIAVPHSGFVIEQRLDGPKKGWQGGIARSSLSLCRFCTSFCFCPVQLSLWLAFPVWVGKRTEYCLCSCSKSAVFFFVFAKDGY